MVVSSTFEKTTDELQLLLRIIPDPKYILYPFYGLSLIEAGYVLAIFQSQVTTITNSINYYYKTTCIPSRQQYVNDEVTFD